MPTIRLFGRAKGGSAQAATAAGVTGAQIGDALAALSTASLSATWRCRHVDAVVISEGAVDFATRRSRATVIRGKNAFEYVREGSTVLRSTITPTGAPKPKVAAKSAVQAVAVEAEGEADADEAQADDELEASEGDELEASEGDELDEEEADDDAEEADDELEDEEDEDQDEDEDEEDEDEDEVDAEASVTAGDEDGEDDEEGDDDEDDLDEQDPGDLPSVTQLTLAPESSAAQLAPQWVVFSDMDACGLHAYAEPAVLAAAVRAAGAVQPRKAEDIDGVEYPAFAVTLKPRPNDPDKVLARLARHLRDHGANTLTVTAFLDPDGKPAGTASVGGGAASEQGDGDGDGDDAGEGAAKDAGPAIVRLRLELAHWTPTDDPTADHSVTVDLFELGEPVEIEVPDRREASRRTQRTCADLALF